MSDGPWKKAAQSDGTGGCVEWRELADGGVEVADTKQDGKGPTLVFTAAEWQAFREGAASDEWVPSRP